MQVRASPRKNTTTPAQKKDKQPAKDKQKVLNLEAEEGQGTEYIDAKGAKPITNLLGISL